MSWTGRKRSPGDRFPSGKLKPKPPPLPGDQPHRKGFGSNPLAETVHGRYYLTGAISEPQHLAGTFYGRTRLKYRIAIGAPDSLRSRSDARVTRDDTDDADIIRFYIMVRSALGHLITDIDWVIIQDAMLADLTAYRQGLDVLRRVYHV
jgi:hypothetical protein